MRVLRRLFLLHPQCQTHLLLRHSVTGVPSSPVQASGGAPSSSRAGVVLLLFLAVRALAIGDAQSASRRQKPRARHEPGSLPVDSGWAEAQ